ncbi:MAG TPA: ADP-ribosylglycohydrolase family protein [Pilimelia sp.]|nr:ADP-ribosylglycohydrolase family protein [Pilimelia sp.]
MTVRRVTGSLFGLAYGDALGAATEFLGHAEIIERYGPGGPRTLVGRPARVTDDTQLALAVAWALHEADGPTPDLLEPLLRERFVAWAMSADNNRAPGRTCLDAISRLAVGLPWTEATVPDSKGCGATMRVPPVGLLTGLDVENLAGIAQLQAALTHGHPTAVAAAELTALAVWLLRDGTTLVQLPGALRARCDAVRTVYRHEWLGELWRRTPAATPRQYAETGWAECAAALDRLTGALARPDDGGDAGLAAGAGWVAEEALATALYCAVRHADEPVAGLGRAASISGDSDSVAALAGALLGAAGGMAAWPAEWAGRIEYADQLHALSAAWEDR